MALAPVSLMVAIAACSSIPAPAERLVDAAVEADSDGGQADAAWAHCRGGGYRASRGGGVLLEGDDPEKRVLSVAGVYDEVDAGQTIYQLYVTDARRSLVGKPPADLTAPENSDLATCRYCAVASGDCQKVNDVNVRCEKSYQAVAGEARVIVEPEKDGGAFWADVGNVVFAKVTRRVGLTAVEFDTTDCIALSRITFQGTVTTVGRPCPPEYGAPCQIADTASKR